MPITQAGVARFFMEADALRRRLSGGNRAMVAEDIWQLLYEIFQHEQDPQVPDPATLARLMGMSDTVIASHLQVLRDADYLHQAKAGFDPENFPPLLTRKGRELVICYVREAVKIMIWEPGSAPKEAGAVWKMPVGESLH